MLTSDQLSIGYWSLVALCVGGLLIWIIYLFRSRRQRVADHMRVTSLVSLPRDVSYDEILGFVRALSGLARPKMFEPIYAVSLETYADIKGIKHYLSIPGHVVEGVEGWLETHIPGSSITRIKAEEDVVANTQWDRGLELTLSSNKPLMIKDPKHIAATILSGLSTLQPDSAIVLQWIVFRAEPQSPKLPQGSFWFPSHGDEHAHKQKVSDATFRAAGRIAAKGEDAYRLIRDVYAGLSVTHTFGVKFRPHVSPKVPERVNKRRGLWDYRIFLNAPELSVVMGWPFDAMNVPGLGGARARRLAPDFSIPSEGIKIATSNYPKTRGRQIALPVSSTVQHQWIIGPTGTGKSALLHNEAAQAINEGLGVVVIEPKGDLARDILSTVPEHRSNDVIWFDATDQHRPIGFNILAGPDPERTTAHIVSLFKNLYHDSWGPRLEYILKYAVLTAALSDLTLYDVKQLLISPEFRAKTVRNLQHPEAKAFWKRREDKSDSDLDAVINKLDAFAGTTIMRRIVGQVSGLNMADVVRDNKILLVPLDNIAIGEANSAILGSMLVDQLWNEARLRPRLERKPILVIIDEFQNFLHLNVSIEDAFAMARSYQLGFVVAHQHTKQLSDSILAEVKNNARTKISFTLGPDDASKVAPYFHPMTSADLTSLSQYEVAMSIMTENGTSPVATGKTFPPPVATGHGFAALRASQRAYGRDAKDIDSELAERHKAAERSRPTFGKRDK